MKSFVFAACVFYFSSRVGADTCRTMTDIFLRDEEVEDLTKEECRRTRTEFNKEMKDVKCMPRQSLQRITSTSGHIYFPAMISLNKCDGFCGNNLLCLPIATKRKRVLVKRTIDLTSTTMSCHYIYVQEHTECRCRCSVMKEDCNENQVYDEYNCECKCINMEERAICNRLKNMVWDAEKCKCTCLMPEEVCSTGWAWIPSMCRCAKIMMASDD
ncbi:balbiani ring protein 3-like [Colletes gigas]|uniref:balbiani ring protein 3-like n=1 Tax=Colletes gigas TaxID=935657 RepID=UPI001C9A606C|nr:balbiani ring protein 3-like [Colletes gigas]